MLLTILAGLLLREYAARTQDDEIQEVEEGEEDVSDQGSLATQSLEDIALDIRRQSIASSWETIEEDLAPPRHHYNLRSGRNSFQSTPALRNVIPESNIPRNASDPQIVRNADRVIPNPRPNIDLGQNQGPLDNLAPALNVMDEPPVQNINIDINIGIGNGFINAEINGNGDVNGILEILGMRGSLLMLIRNVIIAHILIGMTLLLLVFIPNQVGKAVFGFINDFYIPFANLAFEKALNMISKAVDPLLDPIISGVAYLIKSFGTIEEANLGQIPVYEVEKQISDMGRFIAEKLTNLTSSPGTLSNSTDTLLHGSPYHPAFFFALWVNVFWALFGWLSIAVISLVILAQAGYGEHAYVRGFKQFFLFTGNYIYLAFKFVFFIFLELGMFPVYCGFLIDVCTMPIFGSSITAILAFKEKHFWTFVVFHWLLGTSFMFQFAMYVGSVREILRPGVLWFIKDPSDPNFNPMNEILKRPFLSQVRKLAIGVILYSTIAISIFGGAVSFISLCTSEIRSGSFKVFPLRWEFHDSLSEAPIDLLLFHFAQPFVFKALNPKAKFKWFLRSWFFGAARILKCSHFLLGVSKPDEETDTEDVDPIEDEVESEVFEANDMNIRRRKNNQQADRADYAEKSKGAKRLRYMRVPNHDRIEIIPGQKMLVLMKESDDVFGREGETPQQISENWSKVYVPNSFWLRMKVLMIAQILTAILLLSGIITIPLLTGRLAFRRVIPFFLVQIPLPDDYVYTGKPRVNRSDLLCHDFYSFLLGTFVMFVIFTIISAFSQPRQRLFNFGFFEWLQENGKRFSVKFVKGLYLGITIGLIIPLEIGIIFDLFLLLPLQINNGTFFIFGLQDWSIGVIFMKIAYNFITIFPENTLNQVITEAQNLGLYDMPLNKISKAVVVPGLATLSGILAIVPLASALEIAFGMIF
jgi:hypothetical protein